MRGSNFSVIKAAGEQRAQEKQGWVQKEKDAVSLWRIRCERR